MVEHDSYRPIAEPTLGLAAERLFHDDPEAHSQDHLARYGHIIPLREESFVYDCGDGPFTLSGLLRQLNAQGSTGNRAATGNPPTTAKVHIGRIDNLGF